VSRRLRYQVAVSLDGFIAGPNGAYDWIVMDPSIDFEALYREFGVPLLPPGASRKLVLADQKKLPASGILALAYSVPGGVEPAPQVRYIRPAK